MTTHAPTSVMAAVSASATVPITALEPPRRARDRPRPRTTVAPFVLAMTAFCVLATATFDPRTSDLGWYVTVAWSLPAAGSVIGLWGALATRRVWAEPAPGDVTNYDPLIVLIPTVGRHDVLPALARTVESFIAHLPAHHADYRIDVVCEEHSEARELVADRWANVPHVRVVAVPASYATPRRTGFKARANQYMLELRRADGETRHAAWVLHMDDDTACSADTSAAVAAFIRAHNDPANAAPKHLAQGVLTFPREAAVNVLTWLADAVRPADDLSRFAAVTGSGTPLAGLHGELMLARSTVEDDIGWDFGPNTIVEDARWALEFSARYPGRSAWISACCYGASPSTVRAFLSQRQRWAWGLSMLAVDRAVPLRRRLFLGYSVATWVLGPLQHVGVILGVAYASAEAASPAGLPVIPLWALNMGYVVWMYWTGLRVNQWASAPGAARWWHRPAVLALIPLFSLLEGWAGFRGLICAVARKPVVFTVIRKEA